MVGQGGLYYHDFLTSRGWWTVDRLAGDLVPGFIGRWNAVIA